MGRGGWGSLLRSAGATTCSMRNMSVNPDRRDMAIRSEGEDSWPWAFGEVDVDLGRAS